MTPPAQGHKNVAEVTAQRPRPLDFFYLFFWPLAKGQMEFWPGSGRTSESCA